YAPFFYFLFNYTSTPPLYTLALHDALPIFARGIGARRCVDNHLHQVVRLKPGRDLFCRKLIAEGELDRPKSIARRGGEAIEERYLRVQEREIRRKARHDGLYPTMTSDVAVGEPHVQRLLQTAGSLKPSFHHVQQALPNSMRLRSSEPVQWPCDHEQGEPVHGRPCQVFRPGSALRGKDSRGDEPIQRGAQKLKGVESRLPG